jgi:hypothetical protein
MPAAGVAALGRRLTYRRTDKRPEALRWAELHRLAHASASFLPAVRSARGAIVS